MNLIHCFFILKIVCIPTILSNDLVLCDHSIFIEKACEIFIFSLFFCGISDNNICMKAYCDVIVIVIL